MISTDLNGFIQKQFREEYGNDQQHDHKFRHRMYAGNRAFDPGCPACRAIEEANALRQKYGLADAALYQGKVTKRDGTRVSVNERRIISHEERMLAEGKR